MSRSRYLFKGLCLAATAILVMTCNPATAEQPRHQPTMQRHPASRSPAPADQAPHTATVPFIANNANVGGPVSGDIQAELEAGLVATGDGIAGTTASRSLLHGGHTPGNYPKCAACRMVRCFPSGYCSGHCRKNGNLHFCDNNNKAQPFIPPKPGTPGCEGETSVAEVDGLRPSSIAEYDTVVVMVEAPYIGCANIANRPSGCPAHGTRATLPGRRHVTVLSSRCRAEYFVPDCGAPLLPFGVCECTFREAPQRPTEGEGRGSTPKLPQRRFFQAACSTAELEDGSGVGGVDGSLSEEGLVVLPSGDLTQTWFSNFTEAEQQQRYSYSVTAMVRSIAVDATLDVYPAIVQEAEYVREDPAGDDPGDND